MAAFIASYAGPTGQPQTVKIKSANLAKAKKLLQRRHQIDAAAAADVHRV